MPGVSADDILFIQKIVRTGTFLDVNIDDLAKIKLAKAASILNTQIVNYTLLETDFRVDSDTVTAASALTLTLPPATNKQAIYLIRNTSGTFATTIVPDPTLPDTVNKTTSMVLSHVDEYVMLVSDGISNWTIFSHGVGTSTGDILAGNVSGPQDNNVLNILGALNNLQVAAGTHVVTLTDCVLIATGVGVIFNLPLAVNAKNTYMIVATDGNSFQLNAQGADIFQGRPFVNTLFGGSRDFYIIQSDGVSNWNVVSTSVLGGALTLIGDSSGPLNANLLNTINGAAVKLVNTALSPYTVLSTDFILDVTGASGNVTVNLRKATNKQIVIVNRVDSFPSTITLSPFAGDTILGETTIPANGYAIMVSDGVSQWTTLTGSNNGTATPVGPAGGDMSTAIADNFPNPRLSTMSKMAFAQTNSGTRNVVEADFFNVAGGANIIFNLPAANASSRRHIFVFKALISCSFTINATGADTIDSVVGPRSGSSQDFYVLESDGISNWSIIAASRLPLGGDLTGQTNNAIVQGIQQFPVDPTPPTLNQELVFDGTKWKPTTVLTPTLELNKLIWDNAGCLIYNNQNQLVLEN